MDKEFIYVSFLVLLVLDFLVWFVLSYLNKTKWSEKLPKEAEWIYDEQEYQKSMKYEKEKYVFNKISNIFSAIIVFIFVWFWFFWKIYDFVFSFWFVEIITNLIFFWILFLAQSLVNLPFSYYFDFVLEEKFWFNKITKKIFFTDFLKNLILWVIIWWAIIALINFFYILNKEFFWIFAGLFMIWFSVFFMLFYSSLIVPLFNKQTPLPDWSLKDKINDFSKKVGFTVTDIFVIDWSKRSTKANAYFSGFWPKKRIVLFDTLISDLTEEEIVAVLAHEIGHYKKKHTLQMLIFSIFQTGIIFFILGIILGYSELSTALWSQNWVNFALWILAFSILFSPISLVLWIFGNILSRKNEYEADEYAAKNYSAKDLQNALIKLSKNNLSNLIPHKAYEFVYYSHPTVLKRLRALEKIK